MGKAVKINLESEYNERRTIKNENTYHGWDGKRR